MLSKLHRSKQIPIIRAHIPFLRLLILRQTQIRTSAVPAPVLHEDAYEIRNATCSTQAHEAKTDAISASELRCITGNKRICSDYAYRCSKSAFLLRVYQHSHGAP